MRHVVDDADGEMRLRASGFASSSKTALTIAGVNSFDDKPVAAADHASAPWRDHARPRFVERRDDVEIERLADRARLLGAVEHRDGSDASAAAPR